MTFMSWTAKLLFMTLVLAAASGGASANTAFRTLATSEAIPLTAAEMEDTQGRLFVPCVSEICGGSGLNSAFYGLNIAPSSSSFVLQNTLSAYPFFFQPLFPGFPTGSGGIAGIDSYLSGTFGSIDQTLSLIGLGLPLFGR